MITAFTQFGAEEAAGGDILSTLGIDVKLLAFQIVAFLLLVVVLGKWIFPVFFKIIDKREAAIEASNRAAVEASKHAEKAKTDIDAMLKQARGEAKDIIATAKEEADAMVADAETKGQASAERIVKAAQDDIAKEVESAKRALHNETIELVAAATEKVVGTTVDAKVDANVIKAAIEDSK